MNFEDKNNLGFTLVEIAIVMTIVGILIGGILQGAAMIENAKIVSTISSLKGSQAALKQFRQTYDSLPGDMSNATTSIPNCNASTNCTDGDGDNILHWGGSFRNLYTGTPTQSGAARERWLFWKHMALSGFITGVDVNDNGTEEGVAKVDIGGLLAVGNTQGDSNCDIGGNYKRGLWIDIVINLQSVCNFPDSFPVKQIAALDRKIDDGDPASGTLRAGQAISNPTCVTNVGGREVYDEANDTGSCGASYLLQ